MSFGNFNETSESKEVSEAPEKSETNESQDTAENYDDFDGKMDQSERGKEAKDCGNENAEEKSGEKTSFLDKIKSLFAKKESAEEPDKAEESKEESAKDSFASRRNSFLDDLKADAPSMEEQAEDAKNRKFDNKNDSSDSGWERERTRDDWER
ncbi:hypothetical protein [Faecalibacterium prausnitzii]|jgi:hypothetical protein|uniref:hypothetical protein n=1 Tax=Faecalibacterium prausnitzii TaxID=853 RepID=UPI001CC120A7|nr:hypothetical protein [Faecalibacterium prausnitzii]